MAFQTIYGGYVKFVRGTPAGWNSIITKDSDTLYFISEEGSSNGNLYLGSKLISGNTASSITSLNDLTNVLVSNNIPTDAILAYDSASGNWVDTSLNNILTTILTNFEGATADANGSAGLVPAPQLGQQNMFLRGDGNWALIPSASDVSIIQQDIQTLVGADTDKSVRQIATEEVAKIVGGATEAFDTLLEIENWINANPTSGDITVIIADVANLKDTILGKEGTVGLVDKVAKNETDIATLQTKFQWQDLVEI